MGERERFIYGGFTPCVVITYVITVAHPASTAKVKNFSSLSVGLLFSIMIQLLLLIH